MNVGIYSVEAFIQGVCLSSDYSQPIQPTKLKKQFHLNADTGGSIQLL